MLFLSVPVLGCLLFAVSPALGWWWPDAISTYGPELDYFFWLILAITGVTFVVTEVLLGVFMLKYTSDTPGRADNTSHSTSMEMAWTVGTIIILLWLGIYQIGIWNKVKVPSQFPEDVQNAEFLCEVTGRQFEWRFRYPGADGKFGTIDDIHTVNDFHFPVNRPVKIWLKSDDVLHSFFLPDLRIKQDAVPGKVIPVWFNATKTGTYDLVCAELCGWGHYKMRGRIVIETQAEFEQWLEHTRLAQEWDGTGADPALTPAKAAGAHEEAH
jgi:cytochrome c oxidase subunit 2